MVRDPTERVRVYRLEAGSRELIPVLSVPADPTAHPELRLHRTVDLYHQLVKHPGSTFVADVTGDAMVDAFIPNPARLLIDRAEPPCSNDIVLVRIAGSLVVRRYRVENGSVYLYAENRKKPSAPYLLEAGMDFEIWGVVTQVLVDPRLVFFHDCTG